MTHPLTEWFTPEELAILSGGSMTDSDIVGRDYGFCHCGAPRTPDHTHVVGGEPTTEAAHILIREHRHYDDCSNGDAPTMDFDPVCVTLEKTLRQQVTEIEREARDTRPVANPSMVEIVALLDAAHEQHASAVKAGVFDAGCIAHEGNREVAGDYCHDTDVDGYCHPDCPDCPLICPLCPESRPVANPSLRKPIDQWTDADKYREWHDDDVCQRDAGGCMCPCHNGFTPESRPVANPDQVTALTDALTAIHRRLTLTGKVDTDAWKIEDATRLARQALGLTNE